VINGWDAIDWVGHEGAYGPATETPQILRAIASADPQTAADGRFEFYSSLHHQGTVYPATVLAAPFLVELAGRPGVHGRADLLSTIGQLCDPDQTNAEDLLHGPRPDHPRPHPLMPESGATRGRTP
jgi:hypothetical protein